MKTLFLLPAMLLSIALQSFQNFNAAELLPPRWELLGSRKVNFKLDRDEIIVTAQEGSFTALKIKVLGAGINMHKMMVTYGNGEKEDIDLRANIPAGGESRVIDLVGNRRVIRKVDFWYDTKNLAGEKATVELWGKH